MYYEDKFILQNGHGRNIDSVECKVNPLKDHVIIFGKPWIDEKCASYNKETSTLQFFICGVCYQLPITPQQSTPIVQISFEKHYTRRPFTYLEASKDDKLAS